MPRLALALLFCICASAQPLFQRTDEMLNTLSEITGWKVRRKVPAKLLSRQAFRKQTEAQAKKADKRGVHVEELTLKMFGLVPDDFDLTAESVDLISEQAAAFYDYNKKQLFVLDGSQEGTEQEIALAHELAHALADQQNNLKKFIARGNPGDDESTARQAVMEGQATWLSLAYLSRRFGGPPEVPPQMLAQFNDLTGASGGDYPVYTMAPLYVRESLTFPYNEGLRFADESYRKLGKNSFSEVFARPPQGTQHVLHPASYFEGRTIAPISPPQPPSGAKWKLLADGDIGEQDTALILGTHIGEDTGKQFAIHWKGGQYRLMESPSKKPLLMHAIEWDSQESARGYAEAYLKVMRGDRKSTRLNSSHIPLSRMPSSA